MAVAHGYPSVTDESKSATITLDDAAEDQIQAGYAVVASDDGFFSWIQNAVPEVNTQLTTDLQSLVGDKTSPEEMVESLQAAYESGL